MVNRAVWGLMANASERPGGSSYGWERWPGNSRVERIRTREAAETVLGKPRYSEAADGWWWPRQGFN